MGFDALGIEVRKSNMENCLYVKDRVNLPNLNFIQDNVLNLERYGIFDVVFCSGILYHLAQPKAFIELMSRCSKKVVIINTHFSTDEVSTHPLSEETMNEGIPGRWYFEHNDLPATELDKLKWASWENGSSFWIRREYLIQAIKNAGFDMVLEQYDGLGDNIGHEMLYGYYKNQARGTFIGIKS
jgi:SAM-dependent methyltransferase